MLTLNRFLKIKLRIHELVSLNVIVWLPLKKFKLSRNNLKTKKLTLIIKK